MKKLFLLGFLSFGLFSCSEKEIADPTTNNAPTDEVSGDMERSFLSVSIVPANASATRADDDTFRNGSEDENKVTSIRFYFFKENGDTASVKAGGISYYDVQTEEIQQNATNEENPSVEKVVSAIIVIESQKGDQKPAYMAAVLNHNGEAPTTEIKNITQLQDWVKDYSSHKPGTFTMSSSVYKGTKPIYFDGDGSVLDESSSKNDQEIVAVGVYDKIEKSREAALNNPATIYVERVLAKVTAKVDIEKQVVVGSDTLYYVGYVGNQGMAYEEEDFDDEEGTLNPEDKIYVKFLGWNVTADRKTSRLVKRINTEWKQPNFDGWNESWNSSDNRRSYWAVNPKVTTPANPIDGDYNFSTFNVTKDGRPDPANAHKFGGAAYLQENAGALISEKAGSSYIVGTDSDVINSKIIVAAQLVDATGKPLELVEWQGEVYRFGKEGHSYDKTLTDYDYVLKSMASATNLFIQDASITSGTKPGWRKISEKDVKIEFDQISPDNADKAYESNEKRYYVTLKLNDTNAKYGIYKYDKEKTAWVLDINEDEEGYAAGSDDVANAIKSIGKIKHWNTGYTYYWVNIRHLADKTKGGSTTGYYGVVRNHWYDYTFTSVKGLGVPVSDPGQIIYPEEPGEPDYFYLAAEVKILSWRMVYGDNTELGW